jgi:hypothetical protein
LKRAEQRPSTSVPHQDDWSLLDGMFRAADAGEVSRWVFTPRNGHFPTASNLAYFLALKVWALDLTPLRLVNFPICLAALLLTVRVIVREVRSDTMRAYQALGAALLIFNLSFWEHFTLAGGFASLLPALLAGSGLYQLSRAAVSPVHRIRQAMLATVFLGGAVLSFGSGYAAWLTALLLVGLALLRHWETLRRNPTYQWVLLSLGALVISAGWP